MNIAEQLAALKQRFTAIAGLDFVERRPGFIFAEINNRYAAAAVSLYGGHVMEFTPHGEMPVLWESACSFYQLGKPLRGGIPVCWPWFGPVKDNPALPAHGLARLQYWELSNASNLPNGETELRLMLHENAETLAIWPHKFKLELRMIIGEKMRIELISTNTDDNSFSITEALHTYFAVSNINQLVIDGFDGCEYVNALDQQTYIQAGPITFNAETDRVYQGAAAESVIIDAGRKRRISNLRSGSNTSVVWNPWIAKSIRMVDYGDHEFPYMVCVETANVGKNAVTIAPGQSHCMSMTVSVKPL